MLYAKNSAKYLSMSRKTSLAQGSPGTSGEKLKERCFPKTRSTFKPTWVFPLKAKKKRSSESEGDFEKEKELSDCRKRLIMRLNLKRDRKFRLYF